MDKAHAPSILRPTDGIPGGWMLPSIANRQTLTDRRRGSLYARKQCLYAPNWETLRDILQDEYLRHLCQELHGDYIYVTLGDIKIPTVTQVEPQKEDNDTQSITGFTRATFGGWDYRGHLVLQGGSISAALNAELDFRMAGKHPQRLYYSTDLAAVDSPQGIYFRNVSISATVTHSVTGEQWYGKSNNIPKLITEKMVIDAVRGAQKCVFEACTISAKGISRTRVGDTVVYLEDEPPGKPGGDNNEEEEEEEGSWGSSTAPYNGGSGGGGRGFEVFNNYPMTEGGGVSPKWGIDGLLSHRPPLATAKITAFDKLEQSVLFNSTATTTADCETSFGVEASAAFCPDVNRSIIVTTSTKQEALVKDSGHATEVRNEYGYISDGDYFAPVAVAKTSGITCRRSSVKDTANYSYSEAIVPPALTGWQSTAIAHAYGMGATNSRIRGNDITGNAVAAGDLCEEIYKANTAMSGNIED